MRTPTPLHFAIVLAALLATACGSSAGTVTTTVPAPSPTAPSGRQTTSSAPTTATATSPPVTAATTGAGVDPNAPEVVEPGDIPDNQVFIAFTAPDGSFSLKVPEGWARTQQGAGVTFTDKYNTIAITSGPAAPPPTPASVTATGLADVASDPTFKLVDVQPVTRPAGTGVVARYEIGSAPNPVTGKKALLAVERYVFAHHGTQVVLTLSGAKGADNVDPWRTVTESLTWR
jgi:hypothetical protein